MADDAPILPGLEPEKPADAPVVASAAPDVPAAEPTLLEKFDAEHKPAEVVAAEKPVEKPIEAAAEKPPVEAKPADAPAEAKPDGEKPAEKKAEAKPEEKPAEKPVEAKPPEAVPEKVAPEAVAYAYELPETLKLDDATKGQFHGALDAFRADPEKGAQGLINLHNKTMQQFADNLRTEQYRVFNETRRGWQNEVLADPEIGGAGHQTAMGAIARMRDLLVTEKDRPAFEEMLRITGAGDHPQFLKILHNAARFMDEAPLPPPNPKPAPNNGKPPARGMRDLYDKTPGRQQ